MPQPAAHPVGGGARGSPAAFLHLVAGAGDGEGALGSIAEAVAQAWKAGEGVWIASRDLEWLHQRLGLRDRLADGTPLVWFGPGRARLGRLIARAGEVALAGAVVGLGAPLWLTIAALLWLADRGPVFHVDQRGGHLGRAFRFLKFRTMRPCCGEPDCHCEERRRLQRQQAIAHGAPDVKSTETERVTPIGRVLRRSGLDEVPQFLHVLRGEMAVVGPRPYVLYEVESFKDWHRHRSAVRPGITGLWQVKGYHEVNFDQSVMLDLFYAANASWLLDLRIVCLTPRRMLQGLGERW